MEALSIIYQTVVTLKDIYDRVEGNKDACHHLIKMCVNLDAPLKALEKNENRLNASKEALRELSITVQSCLTFCRKYIGKRWFVKVWRLVKIGEQDRFEALEKSLTASMAELHLSVQVDSFVGIGDDLQEMKKHMGAMKTMLYEVLVQGGNLNDFQQSENPQAILANIMTNSEMLVSLAKEEDMLAPVGGLDQVNQRAQKKPRVFSGPILQINHSELTKSTGPNSLLGVGGFGSVYRCEYNGRPAAVKQFACLLEQAPDEADKRRIKREALIMQLASFHPNVIGFLGASVKQGMIVMELAPFSLHDLLFKENRQQLLSHLSAGDYSPDAVHSTRWKVSIMLDIARALSFIHFHGVLHRDIKSRNVMLVVDPNRFATTGLPLIAKVSDFGLALVVSTSSSGRSARSQMEGSGPVGSSAYMSPELLQYKGATAPSYTAGADIYAFGVLANELLTEREPWKGVPVTNIIGKVVNERLRPERFVPAGEQEELLVLSVIGDHEVGCLHHDPALRPTAAELCSERQLAGLRIAANGEPTTAEREMVMKKIEQTILEYGGDDAAAVGDEMSEFTDCDDADSEDQDLPPPAPQAANLSSNFASEYPVLLPPPPPPRSQSSGPAEQGVPPQPTVEEDVHNMPWLVKQCAVLSEAVYDAADVLSFLSLQSSDISLAVATDPSIHSGKILLAEATDSSTGKQYFFVTFRGTNVTYPASPLQFYQSLPSAGEDLRQFYAETFRLLSFEFLVEPTRANKTLVFTGHSLGGACANIMATQFLKRPHDLGARCKCVTFGSPLFAGESMESYQLLHPHTFYHYLVEIDPVPKMLTSAAVMRLLLGAAPEHQDHAPFGTFYSLNFRDGVMEVKVMTENDVRARFTVEKYSNTVTAAPVLSDRVFLNHSMEAYASSLRDAGVFPVTVSESAEPEQRVTTAAGITCATFAWPKADRMVYLKDENILEIIGEAFGLIVECTVMMRGVREMLSVSYASPRTVRINLCPECFVTPADEAAFYAEIESIKEIGITLYTLVGNSVTKVVAFEVTSVHMVQEGLPTEMINQVLPLTHLLSRRCINQGATSEWNLTEALAEMTEHTHAIIYETIPIEFAFNIMTKDYSKPREKLLLEIFLKRLAEVYFISWQELCSRYMLEVILKSIEQLQKQKESLVDNLEDLFFDAFNRDDFRLYQRCFGRIGKTRCKKSGDTFYVSGTANSTADYWSLICNEGISVGVSIVSNFAEYAAYHDIKATEPLTIPFNNQIFTVKLVTSAPATVKTLFFNTTRSSVKVHVFEISRDQLEPVVLQRGSGDSTNSPASSSASTTKVTTTFTHFTLLWEEQKFPDKADLLALVGTCRMILDTTSQQQSIHVQMHGNLHKAVAFLLSCSCNQHTEVNNGTIAQVLHIFNKDLPKYNHDAAIHDYVCGMFEPCPKPTTRIFSNAILYQNKDRRLAGKNNPRKRVIDMLKELAMKMANNRSLVDEQFLCGKTISVKCQLRTGGTTHFFRPVDQAGLQASSSTEMMKEAEDLSNGLLFIGLMMSDMIEVSQAKMIEKPRENTAGVLLRALVAVVASAPLVMLGAVRSARHNIQGRVRNIVDLQFTYQDWWHNVYFETSSFSDYKDLVDLFVASLPIPPGPRSLYEKEDAICKFLPLSIGVTPYLSLGDLIKKAEEQTLFEPNHVLARYTTGTRTAGVIIFFLKLLYHSRQLRELRERFKVVTVAGQMNGGKTTLLKKLLGDQIVTAPTGDGEGEERTMLPTAYCYPTDLRLTLIDLPGCTDERTDIVSSMFANSSEFSIFLISPKEPPENQESGLFRALHETIRCARGPCLICINGFDENLRRLTTEEECKECLDQQSTVWGKGNTLALNHDRIQRKPQLLCEQGKPQCVIHSTAFPSSRPLSIWLTAFAPKVQPELSGRLIFSAEDVRAWLFEVLSHSRERR